MPRYHTNEGDPETRKRGSRNDTTISFEDREMSAKRARGSGGEIIISDEIPNKSYYVIKLLCPLTACGPILGRGGCLITEMHKSTGARIILSNPNDYYPGTVDRVIAISGPSENVSAAIEALVAKLIESQENEQKSNRAPIQNPVVRLLIANSIAGIVIGKGGATIKHLIATTGCKIMLADISESYGTSERILTLQGKDSAQITMCATEIFTRTQVQENCGYVNLLPTYTHFDHPPLPDRERPPQKEYLHQPRVEYQDSSRDSRYLPPQYPPLAPPVYSRDEYSYERERDRRRSPPPYLPPPIVSYRDDYERDWNGGSSSSNAYHHHHYPYPRDRSPPSSMRGSVPPPSYSQHVIRRKPKPEELDDIGISLPTYNTDGSNIVMTIGIPDDFMGLVLGKRGVVLNEIKEKSGAQIQVSNKSEHIPGTNQRKVTVTGSQSQVQQAHSLMLSKLITQKKY